jgi:hypothetical protein
MLARRPKRQKPCPALSFQNAEQGPHGSSKLRYLDNEMTTVLSVPPLA